MNILITGGASGLGKAITQKLASDPGNKVIFTYNRSESAAKELELHYKNCKGVHCDFHNNSSIENLFSLIESENLDVLINNAFTGLQTNYFHKLEPEHFVSNFERNVLPVIRITSACILQFRKKKFGKIITILSSYIVNKPPIGLSEYVAEKNYLHSLSKSWAVENSKFNISSNCISPSFMLTDLTAQTDERILEEMIGSHPLKRILTPDEVADAAEYLVRASQHVNGTNLIINAAGDIQ